MDLAAVSQTGWPNRRMQTQGWIDPLIGIGYDKIGKLEGSRRRRIFSPPEDTVLKGRCLLYSSTRAASITSEKVWDGRFLPADPSVVVKPGERGKPVYVLLHSRSDRDESACLARLCAALM